MDETLISGMEINCGRRTLTVPPLTFKAVKELRSKIAILTSGSADSATVPDESRDAVVEIIHAALIRNYPAMTIAEVEELVDLGNQGKFVNAVMGRSTTAST